MFSWSTNCRELKSRAEGRHSLIIICLAFLAGSYYAVAQPVPDRGRLELDSLPHAQFNFTGVLAQRINANVDNWLLRAPQDNPGMLEMFRLRDRQPTPQLVPWAGEFVGKYLISAVQALRMTEDPRLFNQVSNVVSAFISTQADDGYLGPFPKESRLLKHWDLWGHYHALSALLLWHQHTGDPAALNAARKAADLICRTYLHTNRRVIDAGDPEMNMSILTGLAMLYRLTGEPAYWQMVREIEKDWERAGDYLRAGLDGREYFQSPRPRWESLHDLQALVELWRITGESRYRDAFVHHWRSIRRWDRRNTGAFSSGEQATGNPYAPTAIETCCTVAWMALTTDYLRLTGDCQAADDLELTTFNGGLGAQHSSGDWWTYNTPMDGVREASAHTIVFQARAGTPELNCCSVNGPRVLGLLSDWTVMRFSDGLALNGYSPGTFKLPFAKQDIQLVLSSDYPRVNKQRIRIADAPDGIWTLRLRIPAWSPRTRIQANFDSAPTFASPGSYLELRRRWKSGDEITLEFDFALRAVAGANEAAGKVSLYWGPLLLAYDQAHNSFDEEKIPPINLARLGEIAVVPQSSDSGAFKPRPWLEMDVPGDHGQRLRLIDYATAGTAGNRYRSWLVAHQPPPAPVFTQNPRDAERFRPGLVQFQWRETRRNSEVRYRVEIARDRTFKQALFTTNAAAGDRLVLDSSNFSPAVNCSWWWRVVSINTNGETIADVPPAHFVLDPEAPPQAVPPQMQPGPNGELIVHALRGEEKPKFGQRLAASLVVAENEGTRVNGRDQTLRYAVPAWPASDFTVALRVRIDQAPEGRIGQIFSAWAASMDDPLRLVVDQGKLFARIESGAGFGTSGVPIAPGAWYHVAAVKHEVTLTLFLNGRPVASSSAPQFITTMANDCALGGNPHFSGNEFLAATFADFGLWSRALAEKELHEIAAQR